MEDGDYDQFIENWIRENDTTTMPLPDIELEPHLLISKVRKHYMEYTIKLLTLNYENNQKLLKKNIYLPSAIWRCAKMIEMNAAQSSMLVHLYRRNIVTVINQLKADTSNGKLNKKLFECLKRPPLNEKKSQTALIMGKECTCVCTCYQRKRVCKEKSHLPSNESTLINESYKKLNITEPEMHSTLQTSNINLPKLSTPMSLESHDADEVMLQLEKLFEGGSNDDDIFDGMFSNTFDVTFDEGLKKSQNDNLNEKSKTGRDSIIEEHAAQIKSLDERLASLTGVLVQNKSVDTTKTDPVKSRKISSNKWLCEEYFLKIKLFELLDQLRDCDRAKLSRIKELLVDLFGDDSDDEGVVSPLEESPEFVTSCKERIAPWVVKLLTPYYIKGRITGKALFKSLAKHLIRLIYQCSKYPEEYEVQDFIQDFLQNHKMIRCEADFKQFRIENI